MYISVFRLILFSLELYRIFFRKYRFGIHLGDRVKLFLTKTKFCLNFLATKNVDNLRPHFGTIFQEKVVIGPASILRRYFYSRRMESVLTDSQCSIETRIIEIKKSMRRHHLETPHLSSLLKLKAHKQIQRYDINPLYP